MRYQGDHRSQYDLGSSARLRAMGCTPTSLANALRCATGGAVDLPGDQVLSKVAIAEETNPATSGWSLHDAQLAASRIPGAPPFAVRQGRWAEVASALAAGLGVVLQGDSDQFTTGCSGTFDGDHCIFVHPDTLGGRQSIGDPICADWRTESRAVLQAYAEKLSGLDVRFGTFTTAIPPLDITPPDSSTEEPAMPAIVNGQWVNGTVTTRPEGGVSFRVRDGADGAIGGNDTYPTHLRGGIEGVVGDSYFTLGPGGELYAIPTQHVTFAETPSVPGVVDEAAIRKDQYAKDQAAVLRSHGLGG